jgi:predicted lipoprotein with Yx(FWY)xxD motif
MLLAATGAGLLLAACDGGASGSTSNGSGTPASPVKIGMTQASIGSVLTGPSGKTHYILVDAQGKPVPCSGTCLAVWPPLTISSGTPQAGSGVTASLSSVSNGNSSMQVTVNSDPVYYYAADTAAGQVNGQGISSFGGIWYALQPNGQPIK